MKFEIFDKVKQNVGQVCTAELFNQLTDSEGVRQCAKRLQAKISQGERQALKSAYLPVVTWQASFVGNKRSNKTAIPSGLYMLDIDHCAEDVERIITKAKSAAEDLDIVYIGRSISGEGVRIVAECRPEFRTIAECQRFMADFLGVEYDSACKDWARASYMVPFEYIHYMDGSIFEREPKCVYENAEREGAEMAVKPAVEVNEEFEQMLDAAVVQEETDTKASSSELCFRGIPYSDIIAQYWEITGEEHSEGYRNTALYKLAFGLRYICDFDEKKIKKVLPTLGLPEKEIEQLIHSACVGPRGGEMPKSLREAIEMCQQFKLFDTERQDEDKLPEVEKFADVFTVNEVPDLPPILQQFFDVAPDDFKLAVVLTSLPFLGALGSKLRARYFNGEVHSPSFIACVEAPQANGKSFARKLDNWILGTLKEHDAAEREKLRAWNEARKAERDARVKLKKEEVVEMLKEKPEALIRYIAPTASVTELLKKMESAKGLHLIAFSEEIDTVHKALKRGFSDFSDILRKAFDNAEHGQDYASENSFSGIVKLFYNAVYCGTPKAVRRFFPDVEDGMVSRVIFVTFPDQSFKPVPLWKSFTKTQKDTIDYHLNKLSMVSLVDDEVQGDHEMKMDFMVREMDKWCKAQQRLAAANKDVTRDTFCRRSAVIGFRASMLAFFLWGENAQSSAVREKTIRFGQWVANCCLRQFLLRFNLEGEKLSTMKFQEEFKQLPDEFDIKQLASVLRKNDKATRPKQVIYCWTLAGSLVCVEKGVKYKKV